jgi:hypothetical protein
MGEKVKYVKGSLVHHLSEEYLKERGVEPRPAVLRDPEIGRITHILGSYNHYYPVNENGHLLPEETTSYKPCIFQDL